MGALWDIGRCRDCGLGRRVRKREWIRAAQPRCYACGGALEQSQASHDEHTEHGDAKRKADAIIEKKKMGQ